MELKKTHWIGINIAIAMIVFSLFLINTKFFLLIIGLAIIIGVFPFMLTTMHETKISAEKEEMFLEFARNLVESVKTGTPISKSIINMKSKSYGILTPHLEKLGNQISLGIPLSSALEIFSKDINNKTVSRAIKLIGQAEKAGGDIGKILESVAEAVNVIDKLKKERKAAISSLVVQGYIIFVVFIIIILVMQFKIIPMVSGISGVKSIGVVSLSGPTDLISQKEISNSFLNLLLIQGFFSGLIIGKLAEGNLKSGVKHSFLLMFLSFISSEGSSLFFY